MWDLKGAVAQERINDLARDAEQRRTAREVRKTESDERRQPLPLNPTDVYPDDPTDSRATRGRTSSRRRG
jgi:hypothetical protein